MQGAQESCELLKLRHYMKVFLRRFTEGPSVWFRI